MGYIALRRMRKWVLFLVTINALFTIGWYSYMGYIFQQYVKNGVRWGGSFLVWGDWALIASAIILFVTYVYSLRSKPRPGRNYKILRTILLLIPTGFILGLRLHFIIVLLKYIKPQGRPPFECSGETSPDCYLGNTQFWFSLITGFFVLFEIGMTVAWGPLERPLQYGGTGYVEEANDVFVSPDRTQSYYPQMQQQQQQQQQQGFYPQQPILLQSPSHKIDQSVTPQQPYPQLYQQPQQQNPYLPQQQYQQPFVQQQHQQQRSQPSPQPSPQPSTRGYISQAEQYEMLQQQQYQQQQQQLQQQHSFVQPAPYNPSSGY